MKAVGYARISAQDAGNSIPAQISRIEAYCRQNGLELMQVFVDDGKTGWNFDRAGFIDMQQFCKINKDVQYLIVPHFDRFSRADPVDAMMKERYLREKLGLKILQVSEALDTDTSTGTYQIMRFMQAFAANEERNRIVDRTRNGIIYSLSTGRYCNKPPFGYKRCRDAQGKPAIEVDEDKRPLVKFIFQQILKGSSIETTRRLAIDRGFTIRGNSAVQKILSNPIYAGMVKVPAYKNNPEKIIKGNHNAIITESEYWQTQDQIGGKNYVSHPSDEAMLRGVLRCHCGRKFTAAPSKGKSGKSYWYYFCPEHRKANLSAVKIHEQFLQILDTVSFTDEQVTWFKEQLQEMINKDLKEKGKKLMQTRHQLGKVRQIMESIEEKYLLQPDLSAATYRKTMARQKAEESRLIDQLNQLEQTTDLYWERINELVLPALHDLRGFFMSIPTFKKHMFVKLVFEQSFEYSLGSYRTPAISPIFADKALILKEKGLLEIEQPIEDISVSASGSS